MQRSTLAGMLALLSVFQGAATAQELVRETFEETASESEQIQGNSKKVQWFLSEKGTLNVVDDSAGLASGKALQSKQILGTLPPVILSDPGDSVTVRFDFRLAEPLQNSEGFSPRFGLYYFDKADAGNPWVPGNGRGYYVGLNAAAVAGGVVIGKEEGNGPILEGNDMTQLAKSSKELWVNDTKKHSVLLVITALESGLKISVQLDGVPMTEYSDLLASEDLTLNRFALLAAPNTVLFDNFSVTVKMSGSNQTSAP